MTYNLLCLSLQTMKTKMIERESDKKLPEVGMSHDIQYGDNTYRVYCHFAFHLWFERVYNGKVLKRPKEQWLSIRGLLDRYLNRDFKIPANELSDVMRYLAVDWFKRGNVPEPTGEQLAHLSYDFSLIMGLLLGGADAGKKFSILLARAKALKRV